MWWRTTTSDKCCTSHNNRCFTCRSNTVNPSTLQPFITLSHSVSSFINLCKPKEKPADPEEHLACCAISHVSLTHTRKNVPNTKDFSNPSVSQQQRDVTIFHLVECGSSADVSCVCVRADWTQIRHGVTGHSLIEQQPECDCCPSLLLTLLLQNSFFLILCNTYLLVCCIVW